MSDFSATKVAFLESIMALLARARTSPGCTELGLFSTKISSDTAETFLSFATHFVDMAKNICFPQCVEL